MTVRVHEVTAGYGNSPVLINVSLSVSKGQVCALLGHNGSGKTTLMRCINSILQPTRGQILVMEEDVTRIARTRIARLISFVPQNSQTAFSFSCLEMILMGGASRLRMWSSPGPRERKKARRLCEELGIDHLADLPFNQLSGGQKQLVILTRALFQETPVMLLDEPTAHLDFGNQHKMMNLVRKLVKQYGVTALITLHDPNLALNYCDDVIMLKQGRVIAQGPTHLAFNDSNLREIFGDNIRIEYTNTGAQVVVPRFIPQYMPEGKECCT
ncbi:MAG TPA: ABC transporter ATP-binding protein [Methylomusa anaerophila]|uniref:Hemin import ATP-binding protein HmuV n=1 Tax=Methylomusa anaerophila TaxID=1930071 RepID=A0A348AFQ6_9FIRM|nr:ABC transporter ATP-binding protein [Methylomusa anaerophila]BBB89904.1 hemin import ATP-binding protein HmuV [Methylomusa anaerophila]HML90564.1 ABC transporter ATP-binding protein [Methylomusa anaerophila]